MDARDADEIVYDDFGDCLELRGHSTPNGEEEGQLQPENPIAESITAAI